MALQIFANYSRGKKNKDGTFFRIMQCGILGSIPGNSVRNVFLSTIPRIDFILLFLS